jgi:prevent-host-death family protein
MTVFEARNHFAKTLEAAKDDVVIVTRHGKPVAAIQGSTTTTSRISCWSAPSVSGR